MIHYPALPADLRRQLDLITPSVDGELRYYPCRVTLKDGSTQDHVYLTAEPPRSKVWGPLTEAFLKQSLRVDEIIHVEDSPSRLPAEFANKLYRHGETGMGYTNFTVVFADGSRQARVAGNAVDFIDYAPGKTQKDVIDVIPRLGRDDNPQPAPKHKWCLFSEEKV